MEGAKHQTCVMDSAKPVPIADDFHDQVETLKSCFTTYHSECSGVLKILGQNYNNFILSKSLLYPSVVVSMCLPSTFSQKHKHCFQTMLLLRLLLRLLFGIVLLYWIMCLVFFTTYKPFGPVRTMNLLYIPVYELLQTHDIDVAFVAIFLKMHFISWGGFFKVAIDQ